MKLSQFLSRLNLALPGKGATGVNDTYLTELLNQGCDEANLYTKAYAGYTDFNITAEKRTYDLSDYVPLYLGRDKRGLFFLDSNSEWQKLIPKSEAWLTQKIPNYLNASSVALPTYYSIDNGVLSFYPPPSTTQASGARLFHLKKATAMSASDHYPFSGSTTELTNLKPLDEAILDFVIWKVKPSYGQNTDIDLGERRFLASCRKAAMQVRRSPDITNDSGNIMRT